MPDALRIIADDLTGACDIGAEMLPLGRPVVVQAVGVPDLGRDDVLTVWNTQSRTCSVREARRRVRTALGGLPDAWSGIVLKKVDTALRGHLAAELCEALEQLGVQRAYVLAAIPEVGRTTVDGIQLLGGIPLSETAFARDPQHPVLEASLPRVLAAGEALRATVLPVEAIRAGGDLESTLDEWAGSPMAVVCDAETDDDIESALRAIMQQQRPLLLAGSIGLGRALRRVLGGERRAEPRGGLARAQDDSGVLVVLGSAHPRSLEQLSEARDRLGLQVEEVGGEDKACSVGVRAARLLQGGDPVAIVTPSERRTDPTELLAAVRRAVTSCLGRVRPRGMALIGGETAFEVLAGLDYPPLQIEGRPAPLVVRGRLLAGACHDVPILTKGGSAGDRGMLVRMVRSFDAGGWS